MTEAELIDRVRSGGPATSLGVFGGTFDPVHFGHLQVAEAARTQLGLEGMLLIPAGIPSFKRARDIAGGADRLAMLRLAVAGEGATAVSDRELVRPGITYAVDTLEELAAACGSDVRLVFITGSDAFASLDAWHRAARVVELAEFAVAPRLGFEGVSAAAARMRAAGLPVRAVELRGCFPDISSTRIRAALRAGDGAARLLPSEVLGYIYEHGLYGTAHKEEGFRR